MPEHTPLEQSLPNRPPTSDDDQDDGKTPRTSGNPEHSGWHLLAFERELFEQITPLAVGRRPLIAVRQGPMLRVYDATCPHRGANLGHGGKLVRNHVVCPFHGKGIHLGERANGRLCVREHEVQRFGEAVFVRLSDNPGDDRGFAEAMAAIAEDRHVVDGFVTPVRVPPELVTENAFDVDHFSSVHGVPKVVDMRLERGSDGQLGIEGAFETEAPPWAKQEGVVRTRFWARAFSPTLVVTELGSDEHSHVVITGATPTQRGCTARVAYGVRPDPTTGTPSTKVLEALIDGGRRAFRQDITVWEHLDLDATPQFDQRDEPIEAFQMFCSEFSDAG